MQRAFGEWIIGLPLLVFTVDISILVLRCRRLYRQVLLVAKVGAIGCRYGKPMPWGAESGLLAWRGLANNYGRDLRSVHCKNSQALFVNQVVEAVLGVSQKAFLTAQQSEEFHPEHVAKKKPMLSVGFATLPYE